MLPSFMSQCPLWTAVDITVPNILCGTYVGNILFSAACQKPLASSFVKFRYVFLKSPFLLYNVVFQPNADVFF